MPGDHATTARKQGAGRWSRVEPSGGGHCSRGSLPSSGFASGLRLRPMGFAVTSRRDMSPLASGSASGCAVTSRRGSPTAAFRLWLRFPALPMAAPLARDDPNNTVIPSEEPRGGDESRNLLRSPAGSRCRGSSHRLMGSLDSAPRASRGMAGWGGGGAGAISDLDTPRSDGPP